MSFDCKQCGACCKIAGMIGIIRDADGNKMQREDGACIHLDDNNMCKIYENRPDICRVKEDLNGGYAKTMKVCNDIQPLVNGSNEKLYDI